MLFLYDIGIHLYILFIRIASLKNKKAAAWIKGRKGIFKLIEGSLDRNKKYTWFHFASLGEFEQGRPVLEKLKADQPAAAIVITFFSPSGYEIRKNYPLADQVFYLPADTRSNAKEFIRLINPSAAIFTKYEYWYHYFEELRKNNIPLYVISGIFRKEQPFFKWYGSLHRQMLKWVNHIFVQNESSKQLLNKIRVNNVSVSGDTRFDRVADIAKHPVEIRSVKDFVSASQVFIAGSTWPEDENIIAALTSIYPEWKFIIAAHEVSPDRVDELAGLFPNSLKYSSINKQESDHQHGSAEARVLIIDTIGILSSLYQYGHIAYIGGGFGAGIHNTLEAAAFGLPVIFGPNYEKFMEAKELISRGAAFTIKNSGQLRLCMETLTQENNRKQSGLSALEYVNANTGASRIILNYIANKAQN